MDLYKECERVLRQNWRDGYTVPSPRLYPFQWHWDSGFIALGNLHLDPERALTEMEHLFQGQWESGFLPHIVFHNAEKYGSDYFPSADYWNSQVSPNAPKDLKTSGISQPPIQGYVLERIFETLGDSSRLRRLFDQVLRYHEHLLKIKDTLNCGLISVWHNWESGMDNSPWWDEALQRIDSGTLQQIHLDRKDNKVVENASETRPSDDEYRRYLYLLRSLQDSKYESCSGNFPFQFFDLTFNALFIASSESLLRIGPMLGRNVDGLAEQLKRSRAAFNELLWDEEQGCYFPYDLVSEKQVTMIGAASFLALFAGVPSATQARKMADRITAYGDLYGIPTFDPTHFLYEPKKYWRGPIWVNMNYLIWKGLQRYGLEAEAARLRNNTLEMVEKYGLREYFPVDKTAATGYGAEDFSWSASLVLDMIKT